MGFDMHRPVTLVTRRKASLVDSFCQ